jgi:hypothetical protein
LLPPLQRLQHRDFVSIHPSVLKPFAVRQRSAYYFKIKLQLRHFYFPLVIKNALPMTDRQGAQISLNLLI